MRRRRRRQRLSGVRGRTEQQGRDRALPRSLPLDAEPGGRSPLPHPGEDAGVPAGRRQQQQLPACGDRRGRVSLCLHDHPGAASPAASSRSRRASLGRPGRSLLAAPGEGPPVQEHERRRPPKQPSPAFHGEQPFPGCPKGLAPPPSRSSAAAPGRAGFPPWRGGGRRSDPPRPPPHLKLAGKLQHPPAFARLPRPALWLGRPPSFSTGPRRRWDGAASAPVATCQTGFRETFLSAFLPPLRL